MNQSQTPDQINEVNEVNEVHDITDMPRTDIPAEPEQPTEPTEPTEDVPSPVPSAIPEEIKKVLDDVFSVIADIVNATAARPDDYGTTDDGKTCDCPLCQAERGETQARILPIPISILPNILRDICHQANAHWWRNPETQEPLDRNFGEMIALAHGELSEALEGHRKDAQDNHLPELKSVDVELADVLIRVFDIAGGLKIDLGKAMVAKLRYNATRADHTDAARTAPGGKKY